MPFDVNLYLRDLTTTITVAGETQAAGIAVNKTAMKGLSCVVIVPSVGTNVADTLSIKVQECTESATNSTYWQDLVVFPAVIGRADAAGSVSTRRFATKLKYIRYYATVSQTVTAEAGYGAVKIYVGDEEF